MTSSIRTSLVFAGLSILFVACGGDGGGETSRDGTENRGVDPEARVVRVGLLNDLSGPAASIGRPVQTGFEVAFQAVNAREVGNLPEGWTLEWVTRDHGYNPQQSVQFYNEIHDDVLLLGMSFGTPTTLPLHPMLARDGMIAMPLSLSSRTGQNERTPVVTPTYRTEAMRAVDWAVEREGTGVRLGIVYQQDDFGLDGLEGLETQAEFHGAEIVARQPITPGQADFTAVVSALSSAGAEYVMLAILPSATAPLLGTAAQLGYEPVWMGNTPAWLDRFFDPEVIPPAVFDNFYMVHGNPYWGEDRPGFDAFFHALETYAPDADRDSYILLGYMVAMASAEIVSRTLASGDLSDAGTLAAIHSIQGWDMAGLSEPIDLSTVPYEGHRRIRVLRPRMAERGWEVVAGFAVPESAPAS